MENTEYKYYICNECSRITDLNYKNPTGSIYLKDLIDRTSKSIGYICEDCKKKKDFRNEIFIKTHSTRLPIITEDILNRAKKSLKVRKET